MIRLRVDEAAAIPLAVESASPVSMTVKEEFIDRGGASIQSNKTATPGTAAVEVTPDPGYDALAKVTVEAVPQGALSPIDIDFNDSTGAFTAEARVGTSGYIPDSAFVGGGFQLDTQAAATITPTTVQQQAVAAHKYTKGAVVVAPIPSEYIVPSGTKNIAVNGNNQDVKAYEKVNVNVPNTYAAGDEGKVVQSGALVAQTSDTVTQNGVVDTTLINSLTVNVSGGGGQSITLLASGTYTQVTESTNIMQIPVSFTGTPIMICVSADDPVSGVAQTFRWASLLYDNMPATMHDAMSIAVNSTDKDARIAVTINAAGTVKSASSPIRARIDNGNIDVRQTASTYPVKANTYKWYIWGYAA